MSERLKYLNEIADTENKLYDLGMFVGVRLDLLSEQAGHEPDQTHKMATEIYEHIQAATMLANKLWREIRNEEDNRASH